MDLLPRRNRRSVYGLHYNLLGWATLFSYLKEWNVDVSEFSPWNAGDPISAETCLAVADAIQEHIGELSREDKAWLRGHARRWRELAKAGGCEQW